MINYEEKYKKALEQAKAGKPMNEIFPELMESEDERIRKFLIDYFEIIKSTLSDGVWKGFQIEKILAFIKNQKEQKPVEIKVVYPDNPKRKEIGFYYNKKEVSWEDMSLADRMHNYPYYFHDGMDYYPFIPDAKKDEIEMNEKEKIITYKDQIEIYLNNLKKESYKNAIEDAANWIDNYILSYINLQDEHEDAPNTITLSKYCINAFKEDMLKNLND